MRVAIYARVGTDDRGMIRKTNSSRCANCAHDRAIRLPTSMSNMNPAESAPRVAGNLPGSSRTAARKFEMVPFWVLDWFSCEGLVQTIRDHRWPRREIRVRRGQLRLIATADRWRQSRCQTTVRPFCRSVYGRIRRRNCAFTRESAQAYDVNKN